MNQGEMISRMCEYGSALARSIREDDPRGSPSVIVNFFDGTHSTFARAYAESAGVWLYVVSVDDGYYLFKKNEVMNWTSQTARASTVLSHESVAHGARPA